MPDEFDRSDLAARVRQSSGIPPGVGPTDDQIVAAVEGFAAAFDYWYVRVIRESVPAYRNLIIKRINPFIRRIEYEGLSSADVSFRLVEDYNNRNFVTAGGWAFEAMAVAGGVGCQKCPAVGIDVQRFDPATNTYHLYVLKSGLSDTELRHHRRAQAKRSTS